MDIDQPSTSSSNAAHLKDTSKAVRLHRKVLMTFQTYIYLLMFKLVEKEKVEDKFSLENTDDIKNLESLAEEEEFISSTIHEMTTSSENSSTESCSSSNNDYDTFIRGIKF